MKQTPCWPLAFLRPCLQKATAEAKRRPRRDFGFLGEFSDRENGEGENNVCNVGGEAPASPWRDVATASSSGSKCAVLSNVCIIKKSIV